MTELELMKAKVICLERICKIFGSYADRTYFTDTDNEFLDVLDEEYRLYLNMKKIEKDKYV